MRSRIASADGSRSAAGSSTCVAPKPEASSRRPLLRIHAEDVLDSLQPAHLHGQQPDGTEAVDADGVAELDLRVVDRLQRDGGEADEQRPLHALPLVGNTTSGYVACSELVEIQNRLLLMRRARVDEIPHAAAR